MTELLEAGKSSIRITISWQFNNELKPIIGHVLANIEMLLPERIKRKTKWNYILWSCKKRSVSGDVLWKELRSKATRAITTIRFATQLNLYLPVANGTFYWLLIEQPQQADQGHDEYYLRRTGCYSTSPFSPRDSIDWFSSSLRYIYYLLDFLPRGLCWAGDNKTNKVSRNQSLFLVNYFFIAHGRVNPNNLEEFAIPPSMMGFQLSSTNPWKGTHWNYWNSVENK